MTRNRKLKELEKAGKNKDHEKPLKKKHKSSRDDYSSVLSTVAVALGLIAMIFASVQYWSYTSIARLYTPLSEPKMVEMSTNSDQELSKLWGSYRYSLYG